jgi:DNA-binding transcriptional MerR regulator
MIARRLDKYSNNVIIHCMKHSVNTARTFALAELCALAELPTRTVRYYIQIGLVDRPVGETRAAYYTSHHLEQLLQIRKWTQAGVSLDRIHDLLAGEAPPVPPRPRGPGTVEVWSHVVVADGLEITLEPGRAQLSPEQVRAFFQGVQKVYRDLKGNG